MSVNNLFGGTIALTKQAMDLRMQRQGLLQSNIANLQTPGYSAQDFSFREVMEKLASGEARLVRTDARHIPANPAETVVRTELRKEGPVDLDQEMLNLSENNLMYQVATQIMAKKLAGLVFAIDEGGR